MVDHATTRCATSSAITRAKPASVTSSAKSPTLARKSIKDILIKKLKKVVDHAGAISRNIAGVKRIPLRRGRRGGSWSAWSPGLAWTEVGGELLVDRSRDVARQGQGARSTGKLGDVMKESVQAAEMLCASSRSIAFGIKPTIFEKKDIHVHVPEGATPKDGPSAGVAMVTSIVSVLTGIAVRKDIAMTGEITLRGRVLPIGGLKEKLLAALRGGLKTVLIPKDNEKDLAEIPDNVKKGLDHHSGGYGRRALEARPGRAADADRVDRAARSAGDGPAEKRRRASGPHSLIARSFD